MHLRRDGGKFEGLLGVACFVRGSSDFRVWKCGMIKDSEDLLLEKKGTKKKKDTRSKENKRERPTEKRERI